MLNILFIFVHRASFSFSSNDNYSLPSSDWILDNTSPLFNVKSVLTSDQIIYDTPSLFQSTESLDNNFSNVWTEKERTLLERGLDVFGKSYVCLSQYIGTKNPSQVKNYLKSYPLDSLASVSSTNSLNCLDIATEDAVHNDTVEVVISSDTAPEPELPSNYSLSSLSEEESLDSDSYMGSTTSTASESERQVEPARKSSPQTKKLYVKRKPKLVIVDEDSDNEIDRRKQPVRKKPKLVSSDSENLTKNHIKRKIKQTQSDDMGNHCTVNHSEPIVQQEEETDDVDYDNTNIIFKERKLSKYHLMVKSGDRVLPSGEQVVSIELINFHFFYPYIKKSQFFRTIRLLLLQSLYRLLHLFLFIDWFYSQLSQLFFAIWFCHTSFCVILEPYT
ncbi:uncharacterized protein LOC103513343 [Diaphorina citri]|uniref:Uncharacterized protein LOC103513343 n=1 Tax=Diaphorina citri TaxID=121845 RepID=A0A3Q0J1P2_DIACI|nr:uncharacterized protein LOC103513343 [Diaphorina citri]